MYQDTQLQTALTTVYIITFLGSFVVTVVLSCGGANQSNDK